jgi:hypothetical protein
MVREERESRAMEGEVGQRIGGVYGNGSRRMARGGGEGRVEEVKGESVMMRWLSGEGK